ncbi:MAG: precorrin-6y C5,15-methyltransferase (decarboxylating) subunit CbiE [Eubacteriales bacterium]|nr:precorrin-6y C5,15-methyltransferase (decarboxylating) subunit CbiE [Eubacteriales bacterium]
MGRIINLVAYGMGAKSLSLEALEAIQEAELLLGAPRLLNSLESQGKELRAEYLPERVVAAIAESPAEKIAILLSGDLGFYSAAEKIKRAVVDSSLDYSELNFIPGISSLVYFFAQLKRPWQNAALFSLHGREANLVEAVRRNRESFFLTGQNVSELLKRLVEAGFGDLTVSIGQNLGTAEEKIIQTKVKEAAEISEFPTLSVVLIDNPEADDSVPTGLPDTEFERTKVPMTKSEVRAVVLSKLAVKPDYQVADIGCGSGSVTVELALACHRGRVYALDKEPAALELTALNCRKQQLGNVQIMAGNAADLVPDLPPLDAAFIGGSGGEMRAIIEALLKQNPRLRIVLTAITLESLDEAKRIFSEKDLAYEIVQIAVTRTRKVASYNMLFAENPIFILTAEAKRDAE